MTQLNELLRVIADPTTDYTAWDDAFIRVRMMKVGEEPEFWVKIINAPESYSSARRRRSLIEFFRRHIRPGDTLKRFQEINGIVGWFNETNLFPATAYQSVPLKRPLGESEWMYFPELLKDTGDSVFFSLSKSLPITELLDILNQKAEEGTDAKILEIAFGEPR